MPTGHQGNTCKSCTLVHQAYRFFGFCTKITNHNLPIANFLQCIYIYQRLCKLVDSTKSYCNNNNQAYFLAHPVYSKPTSHMASLTYTRILSSEKGLKKFSVNCGRGCAVLARWASSIYCERNVWPGVCVTTGKLSGFLYDKMSTT